MSRKFLLNSEKDANTLISRREVQELHQQWDVPYASDVTAWTLVMPTVSQMPLRHHV